jgi:hypothetical protein
VPRNLPPEYVNANVASPCGQSQVLPKAWDGLELVIDGALFHGALLSGAV